MSDVHHGKPEGADAADRKAVLAVLQEDIVTELGKGIVPQPQALFVTGDIAATGDEYEPGKARGEYDAATLWIDNTLRAMRLTRAEAFVVPGNHDVQRPQDTAVDTRRLVEAIRSGTERLDDAWGREGDRAKLQTRFQNYLRFAAQFGPASLNRERDGLWWTAMLNTEVAAVRLFGFNTALVARDNSDLGQLALGVEQLGKLVFADEALSIVLTHHPVGGGWLRDEREARTWLEGRTDVHLSGHVHAPLSEDRRSGSGHGLVSVSAGAVHVGATDSANGRTHSYNFAAIYEDDDGKQTLRVWHRRWSRATARFVVDVDNVNELGFAEHPLRPRRPVAGGRSPSGEGAGNVRLPEPLDLVGKPLEEIAHAVQATTGLRLEMLLVAPKSVSLWAKSVALDVKEWKLLLLRVACLLAGPPDLPTILVGFADTSRLKNGLGEDQFVNVQVLFSGNAVRQVLKNKSVPADFWSQVVVRFTQVPVCLASQFGTRTFPDFEAELL